MNDEKLWERMTVRRSRGTARPPARGAGPPAVPREERSDVQPSGMRAHGAMHGCRPLVRRSGSGPRANTVTRAGPQIHNVANHRGGRDSLSARARGDGRSSSIGKGEDGFRIVRTERSRQPHRSIRGTTRTTGSGSGRSCEHRRPEQGAAGEFGTPVVGISGRVERAPGKPKPIASKPSGCILIPT